MEAGPTLRALASAAAGSPERDLTPPSGEEAGEVGFELHYPHSPPMGLLGSDLVVLDREHRRFAVGRQIAPTDFWTRSREDEGLFWRRVRPLPRRSGLVVEAARPGSFNLDSLSGETLDAALRNPEAYAAFFSRVLRWGRAKVRRRSPDAPGGEEEEIPVTPAGGDDSRERLSAGARWRAHWKYPDGTEIEVEYESGPVSDAQQTHLVD